MLHDVDIEAAPANSAAESAARSSRTGINAVTSLGANVPLEQRKAPVPSGGWTALRLTLAKYQPCGFANPGR